MPRKIAWGVSRRTTSSQQSTVPNIPSSDEWIPKIIYVSGGSVKNITGSYDVTNIGLMRYVEVLCQFTVYNYASPIGSISFYIVLPTVTPDSIPKVDNPPIIMGNLPIIADDLNMYPIYMQEYPGSPNMVYGEYFSFITSPTFVTPTSEDITIMFIYSTSNPD